MSALILKILSLFPQVANALKILQWLLAESNWGKDVAVYLAAESEWYFKLAAVAWGVLYVDNPDALKPILLAQAIKDQAAPAPAPTPIPPTQPRRTKRWI